MKSTKKHKIVILCIILFLYISLIFVLFNIRLQHELRSNANELAPNSTSALTSLDTPTPSPTKLTCSATTTDTMLIIDSSNSMIEAPTPDNLAKAKEAAKRYIDILAANSNNRVGLVSFYSAATLQSPLTNDCASVKAKLENIKTGGSTCTQCAITTANQEILTHGRTGIHKIGILLTDGLATEPGTNQQAEAAAIAASEAVRTSTGMNIYTIGLGASVNTQFLQEIASITNGKYYFSPTADQLNTIYEDIADIAGKGTVSGSVFNDANNNGVFETNEAQMQDWIIELRSDDGAIVYKYIKVDSSGSFTLDGLCQNTTYRLYAQQKPGWEQTTPKNPHYYLITTSSGNTITNKVFGFHFAPSPTITLPPPPTRFKITTFLHGIGSSGDNKNPTESALSNKNPLHPERPFSLILYDGGAVAVATFSGQMRYSTIKGAYVSTFETTESMPKTGNYIVRVTADHYLSKRLPNFWLITHGADNTFPDTSLTAGDTNNDNKLNIIDYNAIRDCYSDVTTAIHCDPTKKLQTDINDDGGVNQVDYNLFLRELSVQNGD
jgi:Mg-chelatase subunit ChlD